MKKYLIGVVVRPQGVMGEVKVRPITDDPKRFLTLKQVYLGGAYVPCKILRYREHNGDVFLTLDQISDRTTAEKYRDQNIFIDEKDRVKPKGDAKFICDLVGLPVYLGQKPIGTLTDILQHGAADVFEIDGGRIMFPHIAGIITVVDDKITVDPVLFANTGVYND